MTVPTSHYRSGRLMVRQESGAKIESSLSAAETTGRRMVLGKNFDCPRSLGRVTTTDCLSRWVDPESPCTDRRGPCAVGYVAMMREQGRL